MSRQTIAYLGIPGSFTHSAAQSFFGSEHQYLNFLNFKLIFAALESGTCNAGLVPLENSLAGSIYENYDLLRASSLSIIGEVSQRIEHHLCARPSADKSPEITTLYSHPKAFEQIANFLAANPNIKAVATSDTASAAQFVSESTDPGAAAICSQAAADIYHLALRKRNLEDDPMNFTRFAVLAREPLEDSACDKCSLYMVLPHVPKSLFRALEIIVSVSLNTTKIESRPIPGKPFEYVFYIDFEFEAQERDAVNMMLKRLGDLVTELKILGFYRRCRARE